MPMDSLESFTNDGYSEVVGALIPVTLYAIVDLAGRLISLTAGTNENEINLWLHRIGMRKSAELGLEYTISLMTLPILLPLMVWTTHTYVLSNVSFGFLLVNMVIYALSAIAQSHLIRFTIDDHEHAEIVEIVLEALGIIITV